MARIGIDARMLGRDQASGIGDYIDQLVKRLPLIDLENEYVVFLTSKNFERIQERPNLKKVLADIHWYSWQEQIKLPFIFKKAKLDLLHVPQFNVPLLYNKPFITTVHDTTPFLFKGHKRNRLIHDLAFHLTVRHAIKKAGEIIAVSEFTKTSILSIFPIASDLITTTLLGVDENFHPQTEYDKITNVISKYKIDKPYLLFVGAWRNHKNISGLIKAFEILKKTYQKPLLLVLGGQADPHYREINVLLDNLPKNIRDEIIVTGFIAESDLPFIYAGASVYITPSFIEGFGLNGLEAMQSNVPVVCSKTGSLPEIYQEAALYFNPNSPQEMALQILKVLANEALRNDLVTKGSEQVKKYNWNSTALQTLEIYRKILITNGQEITKSQNDQAKKDPR